MFKTSRSEYVNNRAIINLETPNANKEVRDGGTNPRRNGSETATTQSRWVLAAIRTATENKIEVYTQFDILQ